MSGQSIVDRITAAKHSLAGQGLAKSVCKATTEEIMGPKKKHLDYLLQCTNEPNVSIPQLADLLIERTQNGSWVVVFKALISIHSMMNYGNERFTQYLASNNCSFNLGSFLDKTGVQGYDMSTFIRRYAKYLNEKSVSYRLMAFDFCKVKRGKDDGLLRTMNAEKLLKTLPALQAQLDALLEFDASQNQLTNGVINACFMLMFKDLIRLFACYNDGIINLLEKYFEMNKKQCKEALEMYKRFLVRTEKVSEFLKVAEQVGIDKGDIPDLAKAPSSLLDALEQHLQSLEGKKGTGPLPPKPVGVASAIKTLSSNTTTPASPSSTPAVSETEKQKILEEESRQLQELKEKQLQQSSPSQNAASTNPFDTATPAVTTTPQVTSQVTSSADLFGTELLISAPAPSTATTSSTDGRPSDDLLSLSGPTPLAQNIQNVLNVNQAVHQMQQPPPPAMFPTADPWNQSAGAESALSESLDPLAPSTGLGAVTSTDPLMAASMETSLSSLSAMTAPSSGGMLMASNSPIGSLSGGFIDIPSPVSSAKPPSSPKITGPKPNPLDSLLTGFGGPSSPKTVGPRPNPLDNLTTLGSQPPARSPGSTSPMLPRAASPMCGQTVSAVGPGGGMSAVMTTSAEADSGFDAFGDVLRPQGGSDQATNNSKLIQGDLDSSLASLAGNLNMSGAAYQVKKNELQWTASEKKLTGGSTWQPGMAPAPASSWQPQPAQTGFQQPMGTQPGMMGSYPRPMMPGMMGTGFAQSAGAMGQPRPMGMGQPAMFGSVSQPGMNTAASFQQPTQNTANDPFGAL